MISKGKSTEGYTEGKYYVSDKRNHNALCQLHKAKQSIDGRDGRTFQGWLGRVGAKSGMKIADHWRRTSMEGVLPLS